MNRINTTRTCLIVLLCLHLSGVPGSAGTQEHDPGEACPPGVWEGVLEDLHYTLRIVGFGTYQDPADSTQNPGNTFLALPRYRADLEFRPDLSLNRGRLHLSARPRLALRARWWKRGARAGERDRDEEGYVNEWLTRFRLSPALFVSYGRENLQWGPSYLLSPSNPFFRDNGRSNPKREVPGMDFARLVWLPDPAWTLSLIANTDEGRQEVSPDPFRKTYALKVDYTGGQSYGSLILSHREGAGNRLGIFAGCTSTDALLLYAEASLARESDAYYPQIGNGPLGGSMETPYKEDGSLQAVVLVGGGYTLQMGPTLTLEYLYNGGGYADADAERLYRLRDRAAGNFDPPGRFRGLAARTLSRTLDPGLRSLRRNTLMLQVHHNDIRDVLNVTLRRTQNLDDGSGQFLSILEYFLGDHTALFSVGALNTGAGDSEYGSILDVQWMVGVEYMF